MNLARALATGLTISCFGALIAECAAGEGEVKRIGVVFPASSSATAYAEGAFLERMRELGWAEGTNLVIVRRFADGKLDRLPGLVSEVLANRVELIVTAGTQGAFVAKRATGTVPIVGVMGDPVGTGLVTSLARPGGNLTGVSVQIAEGIPGKWLELVRELVPGLSTVALVVNPDNPLSARVVDHVTHAATALSIKTVVLNVRRVEDYPGAFRHAGPRVQAVMVTLDPLSIQGRGVIADLAQKYRLPSIGGQREFVEAGGLMAYGPDETVTWRRVADYVDRILKGAKPAELPIQQPTEFRLSVNLKTASLLKLTIPHSILLRAEEVIR